jgi:hypothetical protein
MRNRHQSQVREFDAMGLRHGVSGSHVGGPGLARPPPSCDTSARMAA